jgi:hypothetical protein
MQTQGNQIKAGGCRASSHAGGPGFESLRAHHSNVFYSRSWWGIGILPPFFVQLVIWPFFSLPTLHPTKRELVEVVIEVLIHDRAKSP